MKVLNFIAKIISWIALPGLALLGYELCGEGMNNDSPYYLLFGFASLMFIALILATNYVKNSGRTRLIPEIVYIVAMAGNFMLMNERLEMSFVKVLIYFIIILAFVCRVISFVLSTGEYHSEEAQSERRVARADYDYETAKDNYEYEVRYGTRYSDEKNAKERLDDARYRQQRVHDQENK